MYNFVHCCDFCKKLDGVSLLPVPSLQILIRINLVQFCCLCQNIVTFFNKVNSALGKHQAEFLLNQMQQTGIKHAKKFLTRLCQQTRNSVGYASPKSNIFCGIKTARIFNKNITGNPLVQVKTERSHQHAGRRRIQPEYEKYRMRNTLHSYCIFVTDRKRNLREYFYGFFIKCCKPKLLAFFLSI